MGSTMGNDAEFDAVVAELAPDVSCRRSTPFSRLHDGRRAFERLPGAAQFGKLVLSVA